MGFVTRIEGLSHLLYLGVHFVALAIQLVAHSQLLGFHISVMLMRVKDPFTVVGCKKKVTSATKLCTSFTAKQRHSAFAHSFRTSSGKKLEMTVLVL